MKLNSYYFLISVIYNDTKDTSVNISDQSSQQGGSSAYKMFLLCDDGSNHLQTLYDLRDE